MARLQYKTGSAQGSATVIALDSPTQAGSTLIVVVQDFYSTSASGFTHTVTDDKGNTYTKDYDKSNWSNVGSTEVWSAPVTTPGATTVTITPVGGGGYVIALVAEYPDIAATPFDKSAANESNDSTYTSSATATTAQANELLLGTNHLLTGSAVTVTPDGSWTNIATTFDGTIHWMNVQEQIVSATGTYAETGTANSTVHTSAIVTYKLTGGGGGAAALNVLLGEPTLGGSVF